MLFLEVRDERRITLQTQLLQPLQSAHILQTISHHSPIRGSHRNAVHRRANLRARAVNAAENWLRTTAARNPALKVVEDKGIILSSQGLSAILQVLWVVLLLLLLGGGRSK